jgi:hypothetical protein
MSQSSREPSRTIRAQVNSEVRDGHSVGATLSKTLSVECLQKSNRLQRAHRFGFRTDVPKVSNCEQTLRGRTMYSFLRGDPKLETVRVPSAIREIQNGDSGLNIYPENLGSRVWQEG